MTTQDTLVLIKPDAVRRRMIGQIVTAVETRGLTIVELEQKILDEKSATALYKEHQGKWHFQRNIRHITSGPSVVLHVQGRDAVKRCRELVETFRNSHSDLIKLPANLVHATSDPERSSHELNAVK